MSKLTFNEEKHIYKLNGYRILSITDVIKDNGFIDEDWYTEEARQRGIVVHSAAALDDHGCLDISSLHPDLRGYLESWRKLRRHLGFEILDIEAILYNPLYLYAGRPDRRIELFGWEHVIELKTGNPAAWHGYQTAAQDILFGPYSRGFRKRAGAHLQRDGSMAVIVPHENMDDLGYFLSFNATTQARRLHGITKWGDG